MELTDDDRLVPNTFVADLMDSIDDALRYFTSYLHVYMYVYIVLIGRPCFEVIHVIFTCILFSKSSYALFS